PEPVPRRGGVGSWHERTQPLPVVREPACAEHHPHLHAGRRPDLRDRLRRRHVRRQQRARHLRPRERPAGHVLRRVVRLGPGDAPRTGGRNRALPVVGRGPRHEQAPGGEGADREVGPRGAPVKRVLLLLALLAGVAALGVTAGCGLTKKLTGSQHANQAPHTVLFVNGAIDTVNHVVHLYWFGSDVDGTVAGFEWQMKNPVAPADTAWHLTTRTDSLFVVQTPAGYTNPVFSVRAIDNAGARAPNPPRQNFEFSNL